MSVGVILIIAGGFFFLLFLLILLFLVLTTAARRRDPGDAYYLSKRLKAKQLVPPVLPRKPEEPVKVSAAKFRFEEPAPADDLPQPIQPIEPVPDTPILQPTPGKSLPPPRPEAVWRTSAKVPLHPFTDRSKGVSASPRPDEETSRTELQHPRPPTAGGKALKHPRPWTAGGKALQHPRLPEPEEPLYELKPRVPKRETVKTPKDDDAMLRFAKIPNSALNSAAREMASSGIQYELARQILEVFCRIESLREVPPPMLAVFAQAGLTKETQEELLAIMQAAREGSTFRFSKLRTLKPQTGFAVCRAMQKVFNAMREEAQPRRGR